MNPAIRTKLLLTNPSRDRRWALYRIDLTTPPSARRAAPLVAEESGLVHAAAKVNQHSSPKEIIGDNESKVGEGRSWK
jgi:hypothetical protein